MVFFVFVLWFSLFLFCSLAVGKKPLREGDGIDVAAAAKDLGRDVEEATTTARRCLLKILMLIWRSIIWKLCK